MQTPIRILVVDDDPGAARRACRALDRAGYATAAAHSAADAMRSLSLVPPHLVLLDRHLPDADGLEVCRAIKGDPALAGVFVVMATAANARHEEQVDGLEAGADGCVARPIRNREFLARIEAFARMARVNGALRAEVERRRHREEKLEPQATTPTAVPARHGTPPLMRGTETVLLVEDEPAILQLVRTLLERLGYTVLTADTAREALRVGLSATRPIDLLVTDVIMPEMDGPTLATQLAVHQPGMKTLFMSGYTADVLAPCGMAAADVQFIEKPFSMATLAGKLRESLDRD